MNAITRYNESTTNLSFKEFIRLSGVTEITSEAIFFAPDIPPEKLANAVTAYGSGTGEHDVVILIDDTFWGSAKEGVIVTSHALLFKESGNKPRRAKFEILRELSSVENQVILNGNTVAKLTKAGKLELGYVFSVLDTYIKTRARDVTSRPKNTHAVESQALLQLCARYLKPEYIPQKQPSNFTPPTTTPGYHVGADIPGDFAKMIRFSLGLPINEDIIAARDLTRHGTGLGCFAITTQGLYSKREGELDIMFLTWSDLGELSVVKEHKESYLRGVILSNGQTLVTSWENSLVAPFGVKLLNDLIRFAAGDRATEQKSTEPVIANQANQRKVVGEHETGGEIELDSALTLTVAEGRSIQTTSQTSEIAPEGLSDKAKIKSRLIEAVSVTIEKNKPRIIAFLKEKTGEASINALRNDQHVETLAKYLHAFLPAVVRLALKEDVFIRFMMDNRDRILAQVLIDSGNEENVLQPVENVWTLSATALAPPISAPLMSPPSLKTSVDEETRFFSAMGSKLLNLTENAPSDHSPEEAAQHLRARIQFRVLQLALGLPAHLHRGGLVQSNAELQSLNSDQVTIESLAYCLASIRYLLEEEAEFDRATVDEFLVHLDSSLILPYFKYRKSGGPRKTLKGVVQAASMSNNCEVMTTFKAHTQTLAEHIVRRDHQALSEAVAARITGAIDREMMAEEQYQDLCLKIHGAEQTFEILFHDIDEELEAMLIEYLEETGIPNCSGCDNSYA